jgi:UDP-N-acetylmuramate--alanine ligase
LPIDGITSEMIMERMKKGKGLVIDKEKITGWIKNEFLKRTDGEQLLITAGAGDIDTLVEPIKKLLNKN